MTVPTPRNSRRTFMAGTALTLLVAGCGGGDDDSSPSTPDDGTPNYGGKLAPGSVTMVITHRVTITTSAGVIKVGLDAQHAPLSVANFLSYVTSGGYVNTVFHRVIRNFVVQGGGFTDPNGTATAITTTGSVNLESRNGLSNTLGTLAMARSSDPNSGSSQFYFNVANNSSRLALDANGQIVQQAILDYPATDGAGYAVFGTVMDDASLAVIRAISLTPTTTHGNGMADWPVTDVVVTAVSVG